MTLSADDNFSEVAKAVTDYASTKGFQIVHGDRCPSGSTNLSGGVADGEARRAEIVLDPGHLREAIAITVATRDVSSTPAGNRG